MFHFMGAHYLRDDADLGAEIMQTDVSNGYIVNVNCSPRGLDDAEQCHCQRRLASTSPSHDANLWDISCLTLTPYKAGLFSSMNVVRSCPSTFLFSISLNSIIHSLLLTFLHHPVKPLNASPECVGSSHLPSLLA